MPRIKCKFHITIYKNGIYIGFNNLMDARDNFETAIKFKNNTRKKVIKMVNDKFNRINPDDCGLNLNIYNDLPVEQGIHASKFRIHFL